MSVKSAVVWRTGLITFLVLISAAFNSNPAIQSLKAKEDEPEASRPKVLLRAWDKANQTVSEAHYTFELTQEDRVLKEKAVFQGEAFIKKPSFGRVDLRDEKKNLTNVYFWNNEVIQIYNYDKKVKFVDDTSADLSKEELVLWFVRSLLEMFQWQRQLACLEFPNSKLRQRFQIRLTREDKYWAYVEFIPKTKEDRGTFRMMEIVLNQSSHLLRRFRRVDINGNSTMYDLHQVEFNPALPIILESISKDLPKDFEEINFPIPTSSETGPKEEDSKVPPQ